MACSIERCGLRAHFHIHIYAPGETLRHQFVCESHAQEVFDALTNKERTTAESLAAVGTVDCALSCVATFDDTDASVVCLTAQGGQSLTLMTRRLEGWMLAALMTRAGQKYRPLTHEAMIEIARALGGTVVEVLIDAAAGREYRAKLQIEQAGSLRAGDVRAIDGIALALAAMVPLRVDSRLILKHSGISGARIVDALKGADPLIAGASE